VTIAKGQPWGALAPLPPSAPIVGRDAAAAAHSGHDVVGLIGGDLCRTLGGRGSRERLSSAEAMTFPVDALSVSLDAAPAVRAVAHVVARTRGWRHAFVAANAQWIGPLNVAPRGHPDDGLAELLAWDLGWRSAQQVLARMRQGAHLPHPRIAASSAPSASVTFDAPRPVWVDGVRAGRARALTVTVEPDALRVVV
jgi:diacylglycerol kinase family enzyme